MTAVTGGFLAPSEGELRAVDYRLDDFTLDVPGTKSLEAPLGASITAADLELTIEGASTLTVVVEDPHLALWRSDVLERWAWGETGVGDEEAWVRKGRAVDAFVDTLPFRLVKVSKTGTTLTLTFEDREVAYLRQHRGARKASRAKVTRAQFIRLLVSEVKAGGGIAIYCPELNVKQPIAKSTQRLSASERRRDGHPGIGKGSGLTVKGHPASAAQVRYMERVLDVARTHKAGPKATLALVLACIVESQFKNLPGGDADSAGILQYRHKFAGAKNRDVEWCAADFLTRGATGNGGAIKAARANPSMSAGDIAAACQGPRSDLRGEYQKWHDEGVRIVRAYGGGAGTALGSYHKSYQFTRGKDENTWDASGRLVEEVNWRRFMRGLGDDRRLWLVSEEYLFAQRHELTLREGDDGVSWIDGDLDENARTPVSELRVEVRADRWTAWPGMVVLVKDNGPQSGRWIVSSVRRSLVDASGLAEVTLRKPIPKKPEPASEVVNRDASSATKSSVAAVLAAAKRISSQNRPYKYGGGHGTTLDKIGAHDGLDCSSSTSLALYRGGLFKGKSAIVSGAFASSWGKPGRGKHMTVWANAGHVFIEFHDEHLRFDTSAHGSGPAGPHVRPMNRGTAGFTPRHWPGT